MSGHFDLQTARSGFSGARFPFRDLREFYINAAVCRLQLKSALGQLIVKWRPCTFRCRASLRRATKGRLSRQTLWFVWGRRTLGLCCFLQVGGEGPMEASQHRTFRIRFLNTARKDKSVIYNLSPQRGLKLTGRIRSFGQIFRWSWRPTTRNSWIFKHAISTVVMARVAHFDRPR